MLRIISTLVVGLLLCGCSTTSISTAKKGGINVTTIASTPLSGPANTITVVDQIGKKRIVYASHDRSTLNVALPAAIAAAGTAVLVTQSKCTSECGDTLTIANSGSQALSQATTDIKIKSKTQ